MVLFLVWAVWLAFPYFGFGPDSYVRIHDNGDSTLAARVSLRTTSPSHLKTAWNPQPVAGFDQTTVNSNQDLDVWLFSVLPGWLAYGLVMFVQRFIAGYFTYRLLKNRLRLGVLASLCAGLAYALFAQVTMNWSWAGFTLYDGLSLAGLPLILWALDDEAGWSFGRRLAIAGGLGLALGFTSHYFEAVFVVIAVVVWLLVRRRTPLLQTALVAALLASTWAVSEAPAVWGSFVNSSQSQRAGWALQTVPLRAAMSRSYAFVRGSLLDNQVMVVAALLGFAASRFRSRALMAALGASAAIFLMVFAGGVWIAWVRRYAGPLGAFEVGRFYLLAPFALIVSGALGLDVLAAKLRGRLSSDGGRRGRLWAASLTLLVLLVVGPAISARMFERMLHEMRAGSNYAALYLRPELQRLAAGGSGAMPYRVATVYAPQVFAPPKDTLWAEKFGQMPAYAWAYGLETVDGYLPMYPESYRVFWGLVTEPGLRSDAVMREYYWTYGSQLRLFVPGAGRAPSAVVDLAAMCNTNLLSLDNVRYVISPIRLTGPGLRLVSGDPNGKPWPLFIYENARVLPRYFVVGSAHTYPDSRGLLTAMGSASLEELRSVAFVKARDSAGLNLAGSGVSGGQVLLDSYGAARISLSVTARDRSLLVCVMNYSRYWRAYVDGHAARVIPVDSTFLGVGVPGGAHRVELRYQPPYARLYPG